MVLGSLNTIDKKKLWYHEKLPHLLVTRLFSVFWRQHLFSLSTQFWSKSLFHFLCLLKGDHWKSCLQYHLHHHFPHSQHLHCLEHLQKIQLYLYLEKRRQMIKSRTVLCDLTKKKRVLMKFAFFRQIAESLTNKSNSICTFLKRLEVFFVY